MKLIKSQFSFKTRGYTDVIDITSYVKKQITDTGIRDGIISLFADPGSTAGISTMEYEPNLVRDLKEMFEQIAPYKKNYHHHETWGDYNGASHLRSTLMGPSLVVSVRDGMLEIGTWQQIVFLDFDDKGQSRTVKCTIIGSD